MSEQDESYFLKPDSFTGSPEWGSRHGPVICHWLGRLPLSAENVLLPDGTRGNVRREQGGQDLWRRPKGNNVECWAQSEAGKPVTWVWGKVEWSEKDAHFIDGELPQPDGRNYSSLALKFSQDAELRKMVQNFASAYCLYSVLLGDLSEDEAGEVLSDMRGHGEAFYDWQYYNRPENLSPEQLNAKIIELSRLLAGKGLG